MNLFIKSFQQVLFIICIALGLIGCASTNRSKKLEPMNNDFCTEGATRQGFSTPMTSGGLRCAQETQTCISGTWSGPDLFSSCEDLTKSCDGYPHGTMFTGYLQSTSFPGVPCTPATKTCVNGNWSGPEVFQICSEL